MLNWLKTIPFWLLASAALAQAPAPIPPIADTNRVQTYNITSSTAQVQVGFPVFGDCSDLQVTIAGTIATYPSGLWNCASASGKPLNTLPLPITDMVVNFTPPLTSGALVVQGLWHPRNLTVPTAPGISRREYEQAVSTLIAAQRELFFQYNTLYSAGITPIGPALDAQFGTTQGSIFYRGATAWALLLPGTNGQVLQTGGAAANPSWRTITGVGTVTSVASGTGLTGGPITSAGTLALANAANNTVKSNISGGSAAPVDNTQTAIFDSVFGSTQGSVLYRGAANWSALGPGTSGQMLQSGGAAANPSWTSSIVAPTAISRGGVFSSTAGAGQVATGVDTSGNVTYGAPPFGTILSGTVLSNITGATAVPIGNTLTSIIDSVAGNAQGDILYRSGTTWTALAPDTAGKVLTTGGPSANPSWTAVVGTGTVTSVATGTGLTGGPITTTGTVALANAVDSTIKSNISGGSAAPIDNTISAILDHNLGSTQGSVIYRGAATWAVLGPGLSGQTLQTNGGGQNPTWVSRAGAAAQRNPADPTGTTSGTGVMMGLAGAITPTKTGNIIFVVSGNILATAGQSCFVNLRYGTGAAPANGAASTGTGMTSSVSSSNAVSFPFSINGIPATQSLNVALWYDLAVSSSGGLCSVFSLSMSAMEQ